MTPGGARPPSGQARPRPVLGWRGRLEALQRRVLRHPLVAAGLDVARAYERAGGGMLAGGLSFFGFFTIVPAILLFVSILGVVIEDVQLRTQLIDALVDRLDPIRDVADAVVGGLADNGRTGTLIGLLGLVWGLSGFYGALQASMQRLFPGPGRRDFVRTRVRGILTVVLILASMLAAVVAIIVVPIVTDWLRGRCGGLVRIDAALADRICAIDAGQAAALAGPAIAVAVASMACLTVYVAVPPDGPSLREAARPAFLAGLAIGLLTSLFGLVAPLLVRHWLTLGIVGSVFISLVWFNLVFQAMLYGAALARLERDRGRIRAGPPTL